MNSTRVAAIYCRISSDPTGQAAGVERQRADCERLAADLGVDVVTVLIDNDISAFSGVVRPQFEELLRGAREGEFNVIIGWHHDRFARRVSELLRMAEEIPPTTEIYTVAGGRLDLATPTGQLNAIVQGGVAQYESAHKADRIRARARQRAEAGVMTASRAPAGWRWREPCPGGEGCHHRTRCEPGANTRARVGSRAGLVIDDREAPIVDAAYAAIARGESLRSTWRQARAMGLSLADPSVLREVLLSPRNCGKVSHRGEIVADAADGQRIVPVDVWEKVRAILTAPSRRTSPGRPAGTILGGGIARCPKCSGRLAASKKDGTPVYICMAEQHFTRRRASVDNDALDAIGKMLSALSGLGYLRTITASDPRTDVLRAEIADVEQRLGELAELVAAGEIDPKGFAAADKATRARLDGLTKQLSRRAGKPALAALGTTSDEVSASWAAIRTEAEAGNVDRLRTVLAEVVDHITLNTDRTITIAWHDDLGDAPGLVRCVDWRMPVAERRATVEELFTAGMTPDEIAERLAVSSRTVRKDVQALGLRGAA